MRTTSFFASKRLRARRESLVAVWALLIAALVLLTLAAGLRADAGELTGRASRTQSFSASGNLKSLSVESVNGNVEITAGAAFAAEAETTVRAASDAAARKVLDETKTSFRNDDGELSLFAEEPGTTIRRTGRGWGVHRTSEDGSWRVETRFRITVPSGLTVNASSVNGLVTAKGVAGALDLSTVNGRIELLGARRDTKVNTVNGSIDATFAELPKGTSVDARTVNGGIVLRLPANASFRLEGRTMSGQILSTFPLPVSGDDERVRESDEARAERDRVRAERDRIRAEIREKKKSHKNKFKDKDKDKEKDKEKDGEDFEIDLSELNEALRDLNRDMAELSRDLSHSITINLNRSYEGAVGGGAASVHVSNLNGKIVVLAEGTTEEQAKKLTSLRGLLSVVSPTTPRVPRVVVIPAHPVPPVPPVPPIPPMAEDPWGRAISKGDTAGDLVLSHAPSDVTAGQVAGRVQISTQSGQIHVKGAGKGAELSSAGGDIRIESVMGDLKATTSGGDIRAGAVSGDTRLETVGGDVVVRSAGGSVTARTGGGDITLKRVHGPVVARTSGGTISCEITSASSPGGELATGGGDVTVTLPANYRADVDVRVSGVDPDSDAVISQFPEITISHRPGSISGEGKLNGGGPRLTIRSNSGTVTIRKGPAA